ncbi:hypothetical protein DERP_003731 [Dermatophagoides pteronyssinus]|uniref:Integrase zinc-binding domain-containing protein n=1 Tax=Dermatophagoides pteronyssinus TaxID=6956 RepID=A0ABQ8JLU7_DERPT|nr:hypothetical protein DERP_003731 [Dermatophagoides pteronyssinus]
MGENQNINHDHWLIRPVRMEKDDKIDEYIDEFERISEANGWNDERRAIIFKAMLRADSDALQVLNEVSESDQKSFRKIKLAYEDKSKHNMMANVMKLMSLQREKNESLQKLLQRTISLVDKVYPNFAKGNKTQLTRNHLIAALDNKIREKIVALTEIPKTGNDVVAKAEAIENASKCNFSRFEDSKSSSSSNQSIKTNKFCDFCNKKGHIEEECYKKKNKEKKEKKSSNEAEKVLKVVSNKMSMNIMRSNSLHQALIDSGSSISFFPRKLVDDSKIIKSEIGISAFTFNNHPISIIGVIEELIVIDNVQCTWKFYVAEGNNKFLLGFDFLNSKKFKISTDFKFFKISDGKCSGETKIICGKSENSSDCDECNNLIVSSSQQNEEKISKKCFIKSVSTSPSNSVHNDNNVEKLLMKYDQLFNKIGVTTIIKHKINLRENSNPIQTRENVFELFKTFNLSINSSKSSFLVEKIDDLCLLKKDEIVKTSIKKVDKSKNVSIALHRVSAIQIRPWNQVQESDELLNKQIMANPQLFLKEGEAWYRRDGKFLKLCLSMILLNDRIHETHNHFGHCGISKITELMKLQYYHPKLEEIVKSLIHSCENCQLTIDDDKNQTKLKYEKNDSSIQVNNVGSINYCQQTTKKNDCENVKIKFKIGNYIMIRKKEFENKSWIGPFKIVHRKSSNSFIVTGKNNKNVLVYHNQMKMANECSDDHLALISSRGHPVTRI